MGFDALMMDGLRLMAIGMGIVFSFLVLLVGALKGMSLLAAKLTGSEALTTSPYIPDSVSAEEDTIAVISAAIARYRRDRH